MNDEYDKIHFPSQYSHHNPMPLTENLSFQRSQYFQEHCHEFYDPITEWLEHSYLARSVANNKLQYFLIVAKKFGADGDTFARIF